MDAEFYHPQFSEIRQAVIKTKHLKLGQMAERCKKGIFDIKAEKYELSGIPFIRISNLANGLIDDTDMVYLPPDIHEKEKKTEFNRGDILLSKTAYPAASVIFFDKCNISQDIVGISLNREWKSQQNSSCLVAFLNSKYGLAEMEQWFQGNIQRHLALPDVRRIVIPILPQSTQKRISEIYSSAQEKMILSKSLYHEAEKSLMEEMGLREDVLESEITTYRATLSNVFREHRLDAEYFHPAPQKLIEYIALKDHLLIRDVQTLNHRGVQPLYAEEGEVKVVTSKRLGQTSIDYENLEKTTYDEWNSNRDAQIKQFDILIYTTGAYVGRSNCFLEDLKALASNHINILRVKKANPIFVAVFLNSILGQIQVRRCISGSAQAELYPSDISRFVVWDAPKQTQQKIASLVQQSHEARKKANEILEEAKKRVEETIEKA